LILFIFFTIISSTASADIYQWYDGDGDGSLWLSSSIAEPFSNLSNELLWWADLQNVNLQYANISNANLAHANLSNTNLEYADLAFTSFIGADLHGTNMQSANVFYADFSGANLSELENWNEAFWLASKYTQTTIFPYGMDPNDFGMIEIEVPAPGIIPLLGISILILKRRR
jgi:hypothetical protein